MKQLLSEARRKKFVALQTISPLAWHEELKGVELVCKFIFKYNKTSRSFHYLSWPGPFFVQNESLNYQVCSSFCREYLTPFVMMSLKYVRLNRKWILLYQELLRLHFLDSLEFKIVCGFF